MGIPYPLYMYVNEHHHYLLFIITINNYLYYYYYYYIIIISIIVIIYFLCISSSSSIISYHLLHQYNMNLVTNGTYSLYAIKINAVYMLFKTIVYRFIL
jgi:hypothetical protein